MSERRVSRAGKELLANTIHSVAHQNRVLEERLCWRSFRHEREYSKSREREVTPSLKKKRRQRQAARPATPPSAPLADRWDHSGFQQLYPEKQAASPHAQPELRGASSVAVSSEASSPSPLSSSSSSSSSSQERKRKRKHRKKERRERSSSGSRRKHKSRGKE